MSSHSSIVISIFYFGKWPEWFDFFLYTASRNDTIDFIFYTDCEVPATKYKNIIFKKTSFKEYVQNAQDVLKVPIACSNPVKLCDLRPMLGVIHQEDFAPYKYYGWCDIDLIFGDIAPFISPALDNKYEVFSTHSDRVAGHFSFFKNNDRNREMFRRIYRWKESLANPEFIGLDEHGITNAYTLTVFDKINQKFGWNISNAVTRYFSKHKRDMLYMAEQYSTPFLPKPWLDGSLNSNQPDCWHYQNGKLTNIRDGDHKFMYLHFMNFKSSQWRHDGTTAPWQGKSPIYFVNEITDQTEIEISPDGIRSK